MPKDLQIIQYQSEEGIAAIEVRLREETVWLNQSQMKMLFDKSKKTISEHIRNIFKEGELMEKAVVRKFRTTDSDGKAYNVNHYNLVNLINENN